MQTATKIIKHDEESNIFKSKPYYDSLEFPTIGWGFRIPNTNQGDPLPPITMAQKDGDAMLSKMLKDYDKQLRIHLSTSHIYPKLDIVRQAVLLSMRHQSGLKGLLGFRKMWIAIDQQNWDEAKKQIINSKAYEQAPKRFMRNAEMMLTGELLSCYQ